MKGDKGLNVASDKIMTIRKPENELVVPIFWLLQAMYTNH